ncbi:hypothetical protein CC80DRAFT_53555 [Byssothecium circinans]|uniref:Transmembrane protein n=1 Tax=Byssothecium circinans TaxID=147558 RepID=A0A6A5TX71_9PLEO|nr:hypothetical protein CC80DRAFT_53555 [Byssothecium circinans]
MAQAPVESLSSKHAESSTAVFTRNDDPMTVTLRSEGTVDLDDIVRLNRNASPSHDTPTSLGTLTTTLFSSHKESRGTKPTSAGTSYPIGGKGKAVATYASSLSATHGSGSEVEAEKDHAFVGIGDWTAGASSDAVCPPLKGVARTRKRPRHIKHKKPVVIIQHDRPHSDPYPASSEDEELPAVENVSQGCSKETKYLRRRTTTMAHDRLVLAEEGRASQTTAVNRAENQPLSRARLYALITILAIAALTFALSVFAAHYTGRARIACTKGIIFTTTVLMSTYTVLAMIVARRALQEALLAGLLEFFVGFALLVEIREFM